jgi:predicted O-methyltransferase YrrM
MAKASEDRIVRSPAIGLGTDVPLVNIREGGRYGSAIFPVFNRHLGTEHQLNARQLLILLAFEQPLVIAEALRRPLGQLASPMTIEEIRALQEQRLLVSEAEYATIDGELAWMRCMMKHATPSYCTKIEDETEMRASFEEARRTGLLWTHLGERHVRNARIVPNRFELLRRIPPDGAWVEVGCLFGHFSQMILSTASPRSLALVEIDAGMCQILRRKFGNNPLVTIHEGDSANVLRSLADNSIDVAWIDADHTYSSVFHELAAIRSKMCAKGLILLHDYIAIYSVPEAIHQFCNQHSYEVVYLTLEPHLYNTIGLRKIVPEPI